MKLTTTKVGIILILGLITASCLTLWCWLYYLNRNYYYSKDRSKCFTVWTRAGIEAYLIPGKYTKWSIPRENYFVTDIRNTHIIIWDKPDGFHATVTWDNGYPVKNKLSKKLFSFLDQSKEDDQQKFHSLYCTPDFRMKKDLDYFELDW